MNDAQEAPGQFAGSSWALLEALLEGFCGATVEECYEELRLWFFRYALQRTRDRDVADDYADEAFIQVVRKVPRCDPARFGNSGFVGWARTVGLRQIEELERTRRRRERLLPLGDGRDAGPDDDPPLLRLPSHAPSPLEDAESGEIRDRIAAALSGLTERERSVFVLKEIEGFSHDEIAAILGTSVGASKQLLLRARNRLRQMAKLRELWQEYPPAVVVRPEPASR